MVVMKGWVWGDVIGVVTGGGWGGLPRQNGLTSAARVKPVRRRARRVGEGNTGQTLGWGRVKEILVKYWDGGG